MSIKIHICRQIQYTLYPDCFRQYGQYIRQFYAHSLNIDPHSYEYAYIFLFLSSFSYVRSLSFAIFACCSQIFDSVIPQRNPVCHRINSKGAIRTIAIPLCIDPFSLVVHQRHRTFNTFRCWAGLSKQEQYMKLSEPDIVCIER